MPRPKSDRPSYCLHRQSGRAYVAIEGRQHLLPGLHGSQESRNAYDRLIGTWLRNGRTLPAAGPGDAPGPTVAIILLAFWRHAREFYVNGDGQPTGEAENFRLALRPLRRLYGATPAMTFGPKSLKALRAAMLLPQPAIDPETKAAKLDTGGKPVARPGWSRTYANRQTARIQAVFRWAASEELVPAAVADALATVGAIRKGREGARETESVEPVAGDIVERTIPHLPPPVAAMAKLQLLTGARGGELFPLRTCDIDRSGPVWKVRPTKHKTAHHGASRTLRFGPQAQEVLAPLLKLDLAAPIFSPADAIAWRNERQAAKRAKPHAPPHGHQGAARPRRKVRATYSRATYAKAIARACKRECLPHWHPHQLRHTAGTTYRREGDFEAAKIILGHRTDSMTEHYAQRDERKADEIVARIG